MYKVNRIFSNEEGSGLVLALMVLVVLAALGSTLGMVTINSHRLADHTQDTNSAYYIAEAGANMAYEEFKAEILSIYEDSSSETAFLANLPTGNNKPEIDGTTYGEGVFGSSGTVQPIAHIGVGDPVGTGEQRTFTIRSTGTIDGKTRVVDKIVDVEWISKSTGLPSQINLGAALTLNGSLVMHNNVEITGVIKHTTSADFNDAKTIENKVGKVPFDEEVIKWAAQNKVIQDWLRPMIENRITNIDFSSADVNQSIVIDGNNFVRDGIISSNGDMNFNGHGVINGDVIANKGSITFGSKITIKGDVISNGGSILFNNGPVIIEGDVISTNGEIAFSGNVEIKGSIINLGNNSSIRNNNNSIKIAGNVIANGGEIMLGGNNIIVGGTILNPNGKLVANNGGKFYGPILINSMTSHVNTVINPNDNYKMFYPFNSGNDDEIIISDIISTKPATEN